MKKETVLGIVENYLENQNITFIPYPDSEDGELIVADWNPLSHEKYDQIERILERFGISLGWIDEYTACDECGYGICIQPTDYGWQPMFIKDEYGHYICDNCFKDNPESFVDYYIENDNAALPAWTIPILNDLGYHLVDENYETGFHHGQNDSPAKVRNELLEKEIYNFVFVIRNKGQFDITWSVMIKEED